MKGILFTACLTILALVVLTASFLFYQQSIKEQENTIRLAVFDRMVDEFVSTENGYKDILRFSNVSITIENNTVSFSEPIPYPHPEIFNNSMENWKAFVEANSDFDLILDITGMEVLPFNINGARYYHHQDFGDNKIIIENGSSIIAYSIGLSTNISGTIDAQWNTFESGLNAFNITVETDTDSYSNITSLNFTKGSLLQIDITNGQTYNIDISIGKGVDPGYLRIDDTNQLPLNCTINITLDHDIDMSSESGLNITDTFYNINRFSSLAPV
jgi:hypothetical protein